jgi:PIN domain nuclease of toxin-antitoxin system
MGRDEVIILDTHAVIWSATEDKRLGRGARAAIAKAFRSSEVAVSAISFWEIAMLRAKGRLQTASGAAELRTRFLQAGGVEVPVNGEIAILAESLEDLRGDPADRLIAATAILNDSTLVTADRTLLDWRHQMKRQHAAK